jgi:hypothetical protein
MGATWRCADDEGRRLTGVAETLLRKEPVCLESGKVGQGWRSLPWRRVLELHQPGLVERLQRGRGARGSESPGRGDVADSHEANRAAQGRHEHRI